MRSGLLQLIVLGVCAGLRTPPSGLPAARRRSTAELLGLRRRSAPVRLQFGGLPDLFGGEANQEGGLSATGVGASQRWDDESFDDAGYEVVEPTVSRRLRTNPKPIETVTIGRVAGPYKRRRGFHAEVVVQHAGGTPSMHRLWFAHEVLADVAKLRGAQEHHIDVENFAESVVRYLQEQGVDLADEEWGMHDDLIPFSTGHLPLRTLFEYYADLPQYLADATVPEVSATLLSSPQPSHTHAAVEQTLESSNPPVPPLCHLCHPMLTCATRVPVCVPGSGGCARHAFG